jgi:hypothetical protein
MNDERDDDVLPYVVSMIQLNRLSGVCEHAFAYVY